MSDYRWNAATRPAVPGDHGVGICKGGYDSTETQCEYHPITEADVLELVEAVAAAQAEARELRAELAEENKLRKLLHTFAVNVNSLGTLDAASQLVLDMKAFAALSQAAEHPPLMIRCQVCEHHTPVVLKPEPAQRKGS